MEAVSVFGQYHARVNSHDQTHGPKAGLSHESGTYVRMTQAGKDLFA